MVREEVVDEIARRAFGDGAPVMECRQGRHSKDKVGFLGEHRDLIITIRRDEAGLDTETRHFFVKSLPNWSEEDINFLREGNIFSQEAAFFNRLFPELKAAAPHVADWCPRCFLADDRMVVLEDVRVRGYAMRDGKILEGEYARSAARAQARLHASSLLAEAKLGKSMLEVCPEACVEHLFSGKMLELKRVDLCVDLAEKVAQRLGRDARRLNTALRRGFHRVHKAEEFEGGMDRVACHGDTWTNNYMFDGSQPPKCVLIDFQIVRYAPRMLDVVQLVYLTMTRDVRAKEERGIVEAYYEELCASLGEDSTAKKPTMEEVLSEFEEMRLSAFFAAVLYYPVIGLSQKELNILNMDTEVLNKKVMFRENNDFVMELFDRDREMSGRLSDLVNELVDYCEKNDIPEDGENGIVCGR